MGRHEVRLGSERRDRRKGGCEYVSRGGRREVKKRSRVREEVVAGILGVDASFERVSYKGNGRLCQRQRVACCHL
jgi:hypothetical protein